MSLVPFRKHSPAGFVGTGLEDIDRLFDGLFRNALTNVAVSAPSITDLALRVDIGETEGAYHVTAEMPGLAEKDVLVTLNDGLLIISGEKKVEEEKKGKTWHRVERSYGAFRRTLQLPADADESSITAEMKDGVLEIEIGKMKEAKKTAKTIAVKAK